MKASPSAFFIFEITHCISMRFSIGELSAEFNFGAYRSIKIISEHEASMQRYQITQYSV